MITAHIATLPEREESLKQVLDAIIPQVDKVYVGLNGYEKVPDWLRDLRGVNHEILDNSLGDGAKWIHTMDEPSFCITLDDDLICAPNFVKYMLYGLEKYGGAVSLHGRNYANRLIQSFKRSITSVYRCLGSVEEDTKVDLLGTGCTIFDNTQIIIDSSVYEHKNMADVLFSRLCFRQRKPMTVLAHHTGQFVTYIPQEKTIWRETKDDSVQTKILNEFLYNWGVI